MTKTTNYQLNQWAKSDRIRMDDFNADNAKIDAALKEVADNAAQAPKIHFGSYTGDGASSRVISLGTTPKAVLVFMNGYRIASGDGNTRYGGFAVTGRDAEAVRICEDGFTIYAGSSYFSNMSGSVYTYLAIC